MSESESEESFEGSKNSNKRKAYTVEFKLQVVDFAKKSSNHAAANKYKVNRKCVQRWRKNEVSLCRAKSSSRDGKLKKKLGCGRKVSYEILDNDLAAWIRQRRKEKKKISRRIIKLQAESTSSFNINFEMDQAIVPGGCTKYVQCPDVVWNKPFKARIQQLYDTWMLTGDRREWTAAGNPKAPSMDVYLEWIVEGWEAVTADMIKESFKTCGITNSLDGSEDDLIHCFKEAGPVPEGRKLLEDARAGIIDEPLRMEDDEFEAEEETYDSDKTFEFDEMMDALTF